MIGNHAPNQFLYHYTSFQSFEKMMQSRNLWLVSSAEMADMTDRCYANMYVLTALYNIEDDDVILLRKHLTQQDILDVNVETFEAPFFSASFCYEDDNEYLWENYSQKNTGVAVCLDKEYLNKSIQNIVELNYDKLDKWDSPKGDVIAFRDVLYGVPNDKFLNIVRLTKPNQYYLQNQKNAYKMWLLMIISILCGVVKSEEYSKEKEVRILYINRCSEEYVSEFPIHLLLSYGMQNVLKELGLNGAPTITTETPKRRYELNLSSFWNECLIPKIIIGDSVTSENISRIKEILAINGLANTKIMDKKGELK